MKPYYADEAVTLYLDDCLNVLPLLGDASVDAIITDPPYGLEFMGREWDGANGFRRSLNAADAGRDSVFGRTSRTSPEYRTGSEAWKHGMGAVGYSDGGERLPRPNHFSTRNPVCRACHKHKRGTDRCRCVAPDFDERLADSSMIYQQWCEQWAAECLRVLKPGGHLLAFGGTRTWHRLTCAIEDTGFEIRDSIHWIYGSGFPKSAACLKPAHEPIVLARVPARRMAPLPGLEACQVGPDVDTSRSKGRNPSAASAFPHSDDAWVPHLTRAGTETGGRWPPNILLSETAAAELDQQSGVLTSGANPARRSSDKFRDAYGEFTGQRECVQHRGANSGGASRFFPVFRYEAKAGTAERPRLPDGTAHPTVKPVDLMCWLVRLVTPPDGLVLDPFAGSGTTAEACIIENFRCVLVERDPKSAELIRQRLRKPIQPGLFGAAP